MSMSKRMRKKLLLITGSAFGLCLLTSTEAAAQRCAGDRYGNPLYPGSIQEEYMLTQTARILGDNPSSIVNVYQLPTTESAVLGTVSVDEDVRVTAKAYGTDCHDWYRITIPEQRTFGWVYARHILIWANENAVYFEF